MIRGAITSNRSPAIIITLGTGDTVQQVPAFIDTGFTGDIKLPLESAKDLDLNITHTEFIELADKSLVPAGVCLVDVSLDDKKRKVEAIVQQGDILIGMGLFKKFCCVLRIDFRNNSVELDIHL